MFNIEFKKGVKLNGAKPEIVIAVGVAGFVYGQINKACVVTEITGGKHSRGSLHYVGFAADLRSKHLTDNEVGFVVDELKRRLTDEYDVILESRKKPNEHIHIEFQPKT